MISKLRAIATGLSRSMVSWLRSYLSQKQYLIFSSIVVGATTGLVAVFLKSTVHYIHRVVHSDVGLFHFNYTIFLPLLGILLSVWITKRIFKNRLEKGTAPIVESIIKKSAFLHRSQMYSHVVTSAVTVGFGGSAGLESPIVSTGAALGSNYAKTYHNLYKERVLLLACGVAAGIAAAFNAPITGVLFALEVLLIDATIASFIPLMIAAAVGALCSKIVLEEQILLSFKLQAPFDPQNTFYYVLLGVMTGLGSVYYARIFTKIENLYSGSRKKYRNAIIGGLLLAVLISFFPSLFGEGYNSIKALSEMNIGSLLDNSLLSDFRENQWFVLAFVGLVALVKVIATAVTISSGGSGGNFAPSLFVGAYFGFFFSRAINMTGLARLPESNFTIVAMAGILSGVFYAPMTALFLIAEITGGYELMIPLMVVSAISYLIVKYFEPLSMDALKLAVNKKVFIEDKDKSILSSLNISNILETDFQSVSPENNLGDLVKVVANSNRNVFPVIDSQENLVGVVYLDEIRQSMFNSSLYAKIYVKDLMQDSFIAIEVNEPVHSIMKKFDDSGAWNLPVVSDTRYMGFISKSSILNKYRSQLVRTST